MSDATQAGTATTALTVKDCPICHAPAAAHDVVDFNKSCVEAKGTFLPLSGIAIYYYRCERCGFCYAPEMHGWTPAEFATRVYNDDYITVDPDWVEARPRGNAKFLAELFPAASGNVRHLDYGGGMGFMSDLLQAEGWDSRSYDPFVERDVDIHSLGKFDLITSFEVFEHVPNPTQLVATLATMLDEDGLIYFSTLLNDEEVAVRRRLTWWYASPRNGHISLYSRASLQFLASKFGLNFGSFNAATHVFFRRVPTWARHLVSAG